MPLISMPNILLSIYHCSCIILNRSLNNFFLRFPFFYRIIWILRCRGILYPLDFFSSQTSISFARTLLIFIQYKYNIFVYGIKVVQRTQHLLQAQFLQLTHQRTQGPLLPQKHSLKTHPFQKKILKEISQILQYRKSPNSQ